MAIPHGKVLQGPEGGNKAGHWYEFIQSRRRIKKLNLWNGSRQKTKPGLKYEIWKGFPQYQESPAIEVPNTVQ